MKEQIITDSTKYNFYSRFIFFVILVVLAVLLRFYHLGVWSHGFDENYTIIETHCLFDGQPIPSHLFSNPQSDPNQSQIVRLPKMIIASYFVHWLNYRLFGEDEFGSRVFPAVMGSLCVGVVFLLACPLFGFSASLILAVLLLIFPDHILHSQNNRFYSQSFLCISIALLLGGYVAVKRSVVASIVLGVVSVLMVLSHSLAGIIWGIILIGILISFFVTEQTDRTNISWRNFLPYKIILILGFWSIILLAILIMHIIPLAQSWNNFPTSIVTSIHAVLGLSFNLGCFFSLLCVPSGLLLLYQFHKSGNAYWLTCTILCGLSVLFLPMRIAYLNHYNILFSFPFLVILALFIDWVGKLIIQSKINYRYNICYAWIIFVLLVNTPMLVSYYQDGNRYDWRAACQYIREHWQAGDQIVCFPLDTDHYIPELEPKIIIRDKNENTLNQLLEQNKDYAGNIWIPIVFNRYEPSENMRHWFYNNTKYQTRFTKKRYDFQVYSIELFLYSPQSTTPKQ